MRIMLVYQCGIANVFTADGNAKPIRLMQHAFGPCEQYARGFADGHGVVLEVWHCDLAGDIADKEWQEGPGSMFAESKFSLADVEQP